MDLLAPQDGGQCLHGKSVEEWFNSDFAKAEREVKLKKAKEWFNSDFVKQNVDRQAPVTLEWMRRNDRSFSAEGAERREPWWPQPKVTNIVAIKVRRQRLLLDRAYEHGILHFMFGLLERKVIPCLGDRQIDVLVQAMTPVVINELAGYPLVKDGSSVPLTKLRELFGNGKKTKLAHIRDGRLMPLATELGLLEGEKMKDGYKIKIGYLGWVFYEKVYTPIVDETDVAFNRSIT